MSQVEWEDYWRVGPATSAQIDRVEALIGRRLPEDLRQLLEQYQGMSPRPNRLALSSGNPPKGFGSLGHCVDGESGNIARTFELMRGWGDDPYPEWLVPISTGRGQSHFALDYRGAEADPVVVYVDTDLPTDDPGFTTIVASSFTELLEMLE